MRTIKRVDNFYSKLCKKIDSIYFPDVKYYRDNPKTTKCHYAIELFNNGVTTYSKLIGELSKQCNESKEKIHTIVSEFIETFGDYKYNSI